MRKTNVKKTLSGSTAQTLIRSVRIEDGKLFVTDKFGVVYRLCRHVPTDNARLSMTTGHWSGLLLLNDWTRAELAWWEEAVDALTPPENIFLLLSEGKVVGHVAQESACTPQGYVTMHPFRMNNAAGRPVPALGEPFTPAPPAQRPPRMRGPSKTL